MMTTTVHTNISSTSVDGITVLRVDSSDCSGVGVVDTVTESMVLGFSNVCVARVVGMIRVDSGTMEI